MILSLIVVTFTLGIKQGVSIKKSMSIYEAGVKDIVMIILSHELHLLMLSMSTIL